MKTIAERVQRVLSGETISAPQGPDNELMGHVVAPSCGENDGHWYCETHHEGFQNNMQKDSHIHRGSHRLVWWCHKHGPETP